VPLPPLRRQRRWRVRFARLAIAAALLVVFVASGVRWISPRGAVNDVLTARVVRGDLPITITEHGELESAQSIEVHCEVEGEKTKLVTIVPEGTRVKKGDEVCRYDTEAIERTYNEQKIKWKQADGKARAAKNELEVQRNKGEGEVAKAELALTLARLDRQKYVEGEYKVELDKKKGGLELARKDLKEAEDNLEFTRNLVKKGFVQMEQLRVKELEVQQKKYLVNSSDAELLVLEKFTWTRQVTELEAKAKDADRDLERTRKSTDSALEKAKSEYDAAAETANLEKIALDRLEAQRNRYVVTAPQDGIVVYFKRPWDETSRIQPGALLFFQQPIFSLPDLAQMRVKVKVHESVVKKVHPDLTATIQAEAFPNHVLHGTVKSIGTLAQSDGWRFGSGVKEYETLVSIDDLPASAGLKPGMTGEVKIHIHTLPGVLMVPVQALTESEGKHYAYVVSAGSVERREVEVGENNEQFIEVVSGLSEGEAVALDARSRSAADTKKGAAQKKDQEPPEPANKEAKQ
jgi:RND family efflux transporter MFP subunit